MRKFIKSTITIIAIITLICTIGCITAFAASSETEDNNSAANATSISVNQAVSGNLSKSSDVDWYKFTVSSDGYITVSMSHDVISTTNVLWRFQIYHSDGTTYIDGRNTSWDVYGNKDALTYSIGIGAGTYYVKVYASSYNAATYNLKVNFTASDVWETELNNEPAKADTITVNKAYYGSTSTSGDVDWYKFTVPSNGYVTIDFKHDVVSSTNEYWKMEIYQSDAVTRYDECNTYWGIKGNQDTSTSKLGMAAGTYYLKIYTSSYSAVPYNIKVNHTSDSNWETEINNTSSKADTIKLNTAIYGATSSSSDVDWYKFVIEEAGYITINFNHDIVESSNEYWRMYILHSDAVTYYDNVNTYYGFKGNQNGSSCKMGVAPGTYYIKINASSYSSNTYNIKVNFTEATNWETEVNNTSSQADTIKPNAAINGTLFSSSDVDWYRFEVDERGYFVVDFEHDLIDSTNKYWRIQIFHSDAITYIDNTNVSWEVSGNENRSTCAIGVNPGVYYLKVYASSHSSKQYSIKVAHTKATDWETEINNSYTQALNMNLGEKYNATMSSSSDVDWFKFTVNNNCKVSITFNHPELSSTNNSWIVYLYDTDAVTKLQTTNIAGNVGSTATEYIDLDAGVYYVKVQPSTLSGKIYTLQVNEQHDHKGEWVTIEAPTCTTAGSRERVCTQCGLEQTEVVEALGHSFDEGKETKAAGIFNKGEITRTCTTCGEQSIEETGSKIWILPIIIVGAVIVIIGVVNYVRIIKKKR